MSRATEQSWHADILRTEVSWKRDSGMLTVQENKKFLEILGTECCVSVHKNSGHIVVSGDHNVLLVWQNTGSIHLTGSNNQLRLVDTSADGVVVYGGVGNYALNMLGVSLQQASISDGQVADRSNLTLQIRRHAAIEELQNDSPRGLTGSHVSTGIPGLLSP